MDTEKNMEYWNEERLSLSNSDTEFNVEMDYSEFVSEATEEKAEDLNTLFM